mmetsp:Transcript_30325/g.76224  ORF Transcript_30325/g.76224 Transcript_30325/m.76224 type:complete len:512 (-) Transcript_30325:6-1541(-)
MSATREPPSYARSTAGDDVRPSRRPSDAELHDAESPDDEDENQDGATQRRGLVYGAHPLGVKPLGNQYVEQAVVPCRDSGLGTLRCFDDPLLLTILMQLDAVDLCRLASVSKSMYVFSHTEDLWRNLVLDEFQGDFQFDRSWKETFVGSWHRRHPEAAPLVKVSPISVQGFYSDLLFHAWICCSSTLDHRWLELDNVDRRSALTHEQFVREYELPNRPVLIKDVVPSWPAFTEWTVDGLQERYGEDRFIAGAVHIRLRDYFAYARQVHEESPLYIFDKRFAERNPEMAAAYEVPSYFSGDQDLFSLLENRPDYRWIIMGPARSGSRFHIDPNATSAWNALISGKKKWIMFPPDSIPPGVIPSDDMGSVTSPLTLLEWFMNYHSRCDHSVDRHIEFIAEAGDLVFVPTGWWHLVFNITDTIAITQNYVSEANLVEVLRFLRERKDQISGTEEKETLSVCFEEALAKKRPHLMEKARAQLEQEDRERAERKLAEEARSWETFRKGAAEENEWF